jgi:HAD superfamily hydrolase (TIGR01509 family)
VEPLRPSAAALPVRTQATLTRLRVASPARSVTLDDLSRRWRMALDIARDALQAVGVAGTAVWFPDEWIREHTARLVRERQETGRVLEELARLEHVRLHNHLSAPPATPAMLGLAPSIRACIFDLDGVLTASAGLHAEAWADALNEFLWTRAESTGERFGPFRPFDPGLDYVRHLHGRPRLDGVREFLSSRGIRLPDGHRNDRPGAPTAYGLANRKNAVLNERIEREGVAAYEDSRRYLEAVRDARLPCAVVSASANTELILERSGLTDLIGAIVDGGAIRAEHLSMKPAPDTLVAACRQVGVAPSEAAAFETTEAGLEAAREAGVGLIVAVDRTGRTAVARTRGADVVVHDLAALLDPALRF